MVSDINTVTNICTERPRICTNFIYQRKLELLPAAGALELLGIDVLRRLSRIKAGNQFVGKLLISLSS